MISAQLQQVKLHTCNVIIAEVLGYDALDAQDSKYFRDLFATMQNHLFDELITQQVIALRKAYVVQLPDAIIAGTALAHNLTLWSHNTTGFANIAGLQLFDPLAYAAN